MTAPLVVFVHGAGDTVIPVDAGHNVARVAPDRLAEILGPLLSCAGTKLRQCP